MKIAFLELIAKFFEKYNFGVIKYEVIEHFENKEIEIEIKIREI